MIASRLVEGVVTPPLDTDEGDVMVAAEVAKLFRMNVKTVYELAKAGQIPCSRLGRHFRVHDTSRCPDHKQY